jgi:hypothetical protein
MRLFIIFLFLLLILFLFQKNIERFSNNNTKENNKVFSEASVHLDNIDDSEKEIIQSEDSINLVYKEEEKLEEQIIDEEDDIYNSNNVIEESERAIIKIVDGSMNGCPFDHNDKDSPCIEDICIKHPGGKKCKNYINTFCSRKDLDKNNKIGCDIYKKVLSNDSLVPGEEAFSEPNGPPKRVAQLIPQFVERHMIDGYENREGFVDNMKDTLKKGLDIVNKESKKIKKDIEETETGKLLGGLVLDLPKLDDIEDIIKREERFVDIDKIGETMKQELSRGLTRVNKESIKIKEDLQENTETGKLLGELVVELPKLDDIKIFMKGEETFVDIGKMGETMKQELSRGLTNINKKSIKIKKDLQENTETGKLLGGLPMPKLEELTKNFKNLGLDHFKNKENYKNIKSYDDINNNYYLF